MKLDQLTFTRFLAAIAIVIFHDGLEIFPFNLPIFKTLFRHADLGVSYFFVLSGFVMIIAYYNKERINYLNYYLNRIARIYPIYIIGLFLVIPFYLHHPRNFSVTSLLLSATCLQAWVPAFALGFNAPEWSISVEALFYLTFPWLFNRIYKKYSFKTIALPILLIWMVSQLIVNYFYHSPFYHGYPSSSHNLLYYFPILHINEFLIGNVAGLVYVKIRNKQKIFDIPIIICSVAFLFIIRYSGYLNIYFHDGGLAILFAIFITLLSLNTGRITNVFSSKELVFLGEISFAIYILQLPVKIYIEYILKAIGIVNGTVVFYLYFLVLLVVSTFCYLCVERPLRDLIKGKKVVETVKF